MILWIPYYVDWIFDWKLFEDVIIYILEGFSFSHFRKKKWVVIFSMLPLLSYLFLTLSYNLIWNITMIYNNLMKEDLEFSVDLERCIRGFLLESQTIYPKLVRIFWNHVRLVKKCPSIQLVSLMQSLGKGS